MVRITLIESTYDSFRHGPAARALVPVRNGRGVEGRGMAGSCVSAAVGECEVDLDQAGFFRNVIGALAGTMEEVIGREDASAFVSVVGTRIGDDLSRQYRTALGGTASDLEAVAAVLVDLKTRIGASFEIASLSEDEIVLVNGDCPFAEKVLGRPSLCMMTATVFGRIVSQAKGYARVRVEEAIATGHGGCRVRVALKRGEGGDDGHEFFA